MSSYAPYKVHIDQGAESDNKLCNVRAPIFMLRLTNDKLHALLNCILQK